MIDKQTDDVFTDGGAIQGRLPVSHQQDVSQKVSTTTDSTRFERVKFPLNAVNMETL